MAIVLIGARFLRKINQHLFGWGLFAWAVTPAVCVLPNLAACLRRLWRINRNQLTGYVNGSQAFHYSPITRNMRTKRAAYGGCFEFRSGHINFMNWSTLTIFIHTTGTAITPLVSFFLHNFLRSPRNPSCTVLREFYLLHTNYLLFNQLHFPLWNLRTDHRFSDQHFKTNG